MKVNNKNLEAENEILKGVFRIPISILIGGPIGFIYNLIYTGAKANYEIRREDKHKSYLKSLGINNETNVFNNGKEKRIKKEKQKSLEKQDILSYLIKEFNNGNDYSFNDGCRIKYNCKDRFIHADRHYTAIIQTGYGVNNMWGGKYLPEAEFVEKYKSDLSSGCVMEKYRFFNNKVRGTFGYKTKDGFWFTGMFTVINK